LTSVCFSVCKTQFRGFSSRTYFASVISNLCSGSTILLDWGMNCLRYPDNPRNPVTSFAILGVGKFLIDSVLRTLGSTPCCEIVCSGKATYFLKKLAVIGPYFEIVFSQSSKHIPYFCHDLQKN
jgi:hypothetical protein